MQEAPPSTLGGHRGSSRLPSSPKSLSASVQAGSPMVSSCAMLAGKSRAPAPTSAIIMKTAVAFLVVSLLVIFYTSQASIEGRC